MIFELKAIPILIGSFQALVLGMFLLLHSKNLLGRVFFSLLLLSYSLHLIGYAIVLTPENQSSWYQFCVATYPFLFIIGPCHFLYSKSLSDPNFSIKPELFLHFIPLLIAMSVMYPVFFGIFHSKAILYAMSSFFDWITISYVTYSYYILRKFTKTYQDSYSNSKFSHVLSFKRITLVYLIILVGYALNTFSLIIFGSAYTDLDYFFSIIFSIILIVMTIEILHQSVLPPMNGFKQQVKHAISLKKEEADRYLNQLNYLMRNEELFLDENLSLKDLADRLGIPAYLLSKLINDELKSNFYEFVNQHRIEKAKRLLVENHHKVLAIAFESGFSNKTSFNRTFRKFEKMTPTAFRQKNG